MITRVRVKNFKSLADVDVTLGPLTVLVGRNGAGKSAFLDCLRFLREGIQGLNGAISSRGGFNQICKRSAPHSEGFAIRVNVETPNISGEYFVRIAGDEARGWLVAEESAICREYNTQKEVWFDREDTRIETNSTQGEYINWVGQADLLRDPYELYLTFLRGNSGYRELYDAISHIFFSNITPDTLRRPQTAQPIQTLLERGGNLASVLEFIRQSAQSFRSLVVDLQHLIPGIIDVEVKTLESDELLIRLKHRQENGKEEWFNLSQESDGTIRALALLTSIYSMPQSCVLAIEEPELALYPNALGLISDILRGAALRNQVLFTTQSPDLIARFGANELRVVENVDGAASIGILAAHQRQALEEEIFNAGDLLRIEGLHTAPVIVPDLTNA